ncbi:hypothetical protein D9V37_00375 [Nocardioides mangrovicus]|uniref:DUF5667 domain-containing protein n=1 Tax=Nocardioides mangrovicus TaxID=2478913 RepID=A0A3L8P6C0_9ACTN|nr:DUF5667 domain-containing protein [Nocardioides mangrovicus]RLV50487.1 hypothetical protein D9V37_00375 [Nocardioides mangrovicus]
MNGWGTRRAERFAAMLDEPTPLGAERPTGDGADETLVGLLGTVGALRTVAASAPQARPEFVADLRSRLLIEAESALVPTEERLILDRAPNRSHHHRRPARLAAAAVALVIAGGSAGVAVAAEHSLPGQPLYTVKQGLEAASRTLQLHEAGTGRAELHQATTRLEEASALLQGDRDASVASSLRAFTHSAGAGSDHLFTAYQADGDQGDVTAVRDFTHAAMAQLSSLAAQLPAGDRSSLDDAATLLSHIDQEAQVLCAQCGSLEPLQVPSDLSAAPAPLDDDIGTAAQSALAQALVHAARPQGDGPAAAVSGGPQTLAPSGAPAVPSTPAVPSASATKGKVTTKASSLPGSVGSAVTGTTNQVTTAVAGVVDAAVGTVGGAVDGVVNGVTGSLGGSATPNP